MITWLSLGLLTSTLLLLVIRQLHSAVWFLAMQSLFIAGIVFQIGIEDKDFHLFWVALLTIVIKVVVIPFILSITVSKANNNSNACSRLRSFYSFVIGIALLMVGSIVVHRMNIQQDHSSFETIQLAIDMLFFGAYMMVIHQNAMMQGIGLMTIENAIFLSSIAITNGIPFMIELGIFLMFSFQ